MKLGITVSFQHSVFSSGASQTSLALAELFSYMGYTCTFIHLGEETWWEDVTSLKGTWSTIRHTAVVAGQFDRILEVTLCPGLRTLAPCIWIVRKTPLFNDMEACVVPYPLPKRNLAGIAETWVQEELASTDDIQYLELITRRPVRRVPFLWSAIAIEAHRKEKPLPIWLQSYEEGKPFTVHVCETNTSSSSSCLIPLCIYRQCCAQQMKGSRLLIHNADNLKESEYFQKNLWANLTGDLAAESAFVGRQRIVDIPSMQNTILFAHSRFMNIRPYLLDALWCGIPVVHNSVLLKELSIDKGYYPNNDILAGAVAAKNLMNNWISQTELFQLRKSILHRFGILNESLRRRWKEACESVSGVTPQKTLRIGFSDMWDNFNPEYNFFTLLLRATFPTYTVEVSENPDVLIFGPFGDRWKSYSCPKIHYTGENTGPIEGVALNMGFRRETSGYIRLPLWMLEIDWFNADAEKIRNPIPVKAEPESIRLRSKFCAFVVSNPCQPVRNRAFRTLCEYKEVDSAGKLYNTLGTELFAGLGGGGGEAKKVEFLRAYKFCLAYENAASPGYVTEKLLHAKAAGCVPIYWGAPDVELDFNMEGVIDARGKTDEELIAEIKRVDEDDTLWLKMANTPLIRDAKPLFALLEVVARSIVSSASASSASASSASAEDQEKEQTSSPVTLVKTETLVKGASNSNLGNTVFVTGCNGRFVETLLRYWLPPIAAQKAVSTNVQVHVYLFDTTDAQKESILLAFPFVKLFSLPQISPFPDCWNPQHFLWKLWILKETCASVEPGFPVLYLDTGAYFCRWPYAKHTTKEPSAKHTTKEPSWLHRVKEHGICVLEDANHDNRHMCSKSFIQEMRLTEAELNSPQIWAGSMAFLAGHPLATRLFTEAWVLGQNPKILVGEKWTGVDAANKPFGHRHDQSILSVLSMRHGIVRHPLADVYCHTSLRHTFLKGLSLYVHRGFFILNDPIAQGVDTTWVINLDRRPDRMARGNFSEKAIRFPAIDGRQLRLTPDIVRMFSSSQGINWSKGVVACALSHISLWMKLVTDKSNIESYLVLEDDAVLDSQAVPMLNYIYDKGLLPADCDVLYLGGILPPNKEGFATVIEPVNECIGRVKENSLFTGTPSRYFHFCAYSYIIRRSGAKKLIDRLSREGCWAPADHLLCRDLNIYFTTPLVAGCYQDTDPRYAESNFNTFGKEEYDSDLRNEEKFTEEEIWSVTPTSDFSLKRALNDAQASPLAEERANSQASPLAEERANSQASPLTEERANSQASPLTEERAKTYPMIFHDIDGLFEKEWIEELLGKRMVDIQTEVPIVLYQRPYCDKLKETLAAWPAFTLIHLSDEDARDPIDIYSWPACKGVVRNYLRKIPLNAQSKVVTIPLGYHWHPLTKTQAHKKDLVWSFIGAEHHGRTVKLNPFKGIEPNKCILQKTWNSSEKCEEDEVVDSLVRSLCVPCPRGVNVETFRLYEALEAGCVPIVVEETGSAEYLAYLKRFLPIATSPDWPTAARVVHGLSKQLDLYKEYRKSLMTGWASMKQWASSEAKRILGLSGSKSQKGRVKV
jgi:alpha(1,3/1,4) fucosyltransferase